MSHLDELKQASDQAHQEAWEIQAGRDAALQAVRDEWDNKLIEANQRAAEAQKAACDREAAEALLGRPDAEAVAANLGLELPTEE